MTTHSFKPGDKVHIINSTISGTYFIEGEAPIIAPAADDRYVVDFGDSYGDVVRFVDPKAQSNPARYVADLNAA